KDGEPFYHELFPLLRKRGLEMGCYFESFSLPSESLLKAFSKTFDLRSSFLALSPESGDERIRARNKAFSFSNDALMKAISTAQGLGIRVDIFFAMGIPGETFADLKKTMALRRDIKRRFNNIGRTWTSPISLEPGAPWHQDPERFGIVSTRTTFDDFYRAGSPDGGGLGYYIPDYMNNGRGLGEKEFERTLKAEKCRHHCSLHPNAAKAASPFWGRQYCRFLRWRMGGRLESHSNR
ncbi:MAG: hypothetical protein GY849_07085, partial [Deltaproteobacteria bacterium]|nr:hypothetical protein [Deltaproteobacteria bacterium]